LIGLGDLYQDLRKSLYPMDSLTVDQDLRKVPIDTSDWKRNGSCWNHRLVVVDSHWLAVDSYWSIQN
ncbi:hypothetical protein Taro_043973, partial [Colocasia esculenta]|nr:hypothetical protein [Colocasia esculenta]